MLRDALKPVLSAGKWFCAEGAWTIRILSLIKLQVESNMVQQPSTGVSTSFV
jgi:hypothetical protein